MMRIAILSVVALLALNGCDDGAPVADSGGKSKMSLQLLDFSHEIKDGRHRYNHKRVFTETGGVGTTVVRGRVCVENGTDCADALVSYRVEASQTLEQPNHYVATRAAKDRITLHYWAEDDAGNKYEFEKVVHTDGATATVE
jgi:hypothetical protein